MPVRLTIRIYSLKEIEMEHIDKVSGTFDKRNVEIKANVPTAVIKRLPRYHRYLGDLIRDGRLRISSAELSRMMGVTASQIRQDLNCFGGFGQQGYGYNIKYLHGKISELLGVTEGYNAIIVGAGNLGRALAATHMFERRGVNRLAMFDIDERVVGTSIYGIPVYHVSTLGEFCKSKKVDIAVLTVPKEAAEEVAGVMAEAGVRGFWNFANMELTLPHPTAIVENIHLGDSLMTLCYEVKNVGEDGNKNE
jgi:redox-sensing transcriptional repressor